MPAKPLSELAARHRVAELVAELELTGRANQAFATRHEANLDIIFELRSQLSQQRAVVEAAQKLVESAWSSLYEVGEDNEDTSRILDLLTRVLAKLRYETKGHSEDCALRMENCEQCTCKQALASAPSSEPAEAETGDEPEKWFKKCARCGGPMDEMAEEGPMCTDCAAQVEAETGRAGKG